MRSSDGEGDGVTVVMVGGDIAYCWYEEDCSERHFSFSCEMDLSNWVL